MNKIVRYSKVETFAKKLETNINTANFIINDYVESYGVEKENSKEISPKIMFQVGKYAQYFGITSVDEKLYYWLENK